MLFNTLIAAAVRRRLKIARNMLLARGAGSRFPHLFSLSEWPCAPCRCGESNFTRFLHFGNDLTHRQRLVWDLSNPEPSRQKKRG